MRMVIIAVIALLVLGGGGAGAYFYFQKPAEAAATESAGEVADSHDKAKGEDHAKEGKGGHGAESKFVELDPLILPIVDNNGVTQTVSMVIALEVADEETAKSVEAMAPKLKDAYIEDMYGVLSERSALKGGVIQVGTIKERLNRLSTEVLGENVVQGVLLQVVQQRPI